MEARKVPAGHGWQWLTGAIDLVKRHPVPFLVMGLILSIIAIIPLLGSLVVLILGPALISGTCYAAREASAGRTPEIGHLFRGFQEGDRIGALISLCLPTIVGMVLAGIIFGVVATGAIVAGGESLMSEVQSNPMALFAALGASLGILVPLLLVIALCIYAMTFFAIPRTMLERAEGFANMKESFGACWKNLGAFLVAVLSLLAVVIVLTILFNLLHLSTLGGIVVGALLYAVLGPMLYLGYREVYGAGNAAADSAPPPAQPPAEAPPPSE